MQNATAPAGKFRVSMIDDSAMAASHFIADFDSLEDAKEFIASQRHSGNIFFVCDENHKCEI